jgi:hypothetical protein
MKINEKRGITQLTGFFVAFKIHVLLNLAEKKHKVK